MSGVMSFQRESFSPDLLHEVEALASQHLAEVSDLGLEVNVDLGFYRTVEQAGALRIYTVRNGSLLGYASFFISPHPHHKTTIHARQDLLYLAPKIRKGRLGLQFIRWCDERLKEDGAEFVHQFSSMKMDIGPLLKRIGYAPLETDYIRKVA